MVRLALALVVVLAPTAAHAHIQLVDPPPRSNTDSNKTGPCDNTPSPGAPRTTFLPGETIEVEWLETVDHVGSFRLAFSPQGDSGFDDHVLVEAIADGNDAAPRTVTATITLPTEPCEDCTLQLIQCMKDGGATECRNYYSCADIRLSGEPLPAIDAGPDEPDAGQGGDDSSDDGVENPGGDGDNTFSGGCVAAPGGTSAGVFGAGILLLVLSGYLLGREAVRERPRRRRRD